MASSSRVLEDSDPWHSAAAWRGRRRPQRGHPCLSICSGDFNEWHDDGVGIDELVAYEYAKVRRLYSRLHLPTHTTIEFFPGGHIINAQGTFTLLQQHLQWPK